jgi:hypothetical protein
LPGRQGGQPGEPAELLLPAVSGQELGVRGALFIRAAEHTKTEQPHAQQDHQIRNIEDARAQISQAKIHEIDYSAAIEESIEQVAEAASNDQGQSQAAVQSELSPDKGEHQHSGQHDSYEDDEETSSEVLREAGSHAEEGAAILCILEPKQVAQIGDGVRCCQMFPGDTLGCLIACDAGTEYQNHQDSSFHSMHYVFL